MRELRCKKCRKLLMKLSADSRGNFEVKCRCGFLNHFTFSEPVRVAPYTQGSERKVFGSAGVQM